MLVSAIAMFAEYTFEAGGIYYSTSRYTPGEVTVSRPGMSPLFNYEVSMIDGIPWADGFENTYEGDVVIPSEVRYDGTSYAVTRVAVAAFSNCHNLTSVKLPSSVREISRAAFYGCENLKSLEISGKVKAIEYDTFNGCSSLESLDLSNVQESLDLCGCENLCDVILPYNASNYFIEGNGKAQKFRIYNPVPPYISVLFRDLGSGSELYTVDSNYDMAADWAAGFGYDKIRPMEEYTSAKAPETTVEWSIKGQTLSAPGKHSLRVYKTDGSLAAEIAPGASRNLDAGIYVVSCGGASGKIIIE